MTNYVVLKRDEEEQACWEQLTAQHAISARQAIRMTVNGGGGPGTYVAVPVRSFKMETAEVEIEQRLKFS